MRKAFVFCVFFFAGALLLLTSSRPTLGQATAGRVIGTVYDQQDAVVPGAQVTAVNTATQIKSATMSKADGTYEILNAPIGIYHVEVEKDGFQKAVTQEKKLEINQSLQFDVHLTVGAAAQTVTVEATVSNVETVNPTIGSTVTGEAIRQAPLNGRNVLDLALLQPGVTEANSDFSGAGSHSQGGAFEIAGARPDATTYLLDGSINNNLLDNSVVFNPNPDTIAEFRVLESNYTAEYGRNSGGIITVETKPGTNQWHGSGFDFFRNGDLDANSYFRKQVGNPRDPLRRNQYGGTFGGPIKIPHLIDGKDRFFFFVGYEGQKQSDQASPLFQQVDVLSTAEAACIATPSAGCNFSSDPSVVSFLASNPFYQDPSKAPGFLKPAALNPVAVKYVTKGLLPVTSAGFVTPTGSQTNNFNELTMRFDLQITQSDKVTATLGGARNPILDPFVTASNFIPWADVGGFSVQGGRNNYFLNLAYTKTISPTKLNELRFVTQRNRTLQGVPVGPNAQNTAASLGFTNFTPDDPSGPPLVGINAESTTFGYTYSGPTTFVNNTFGLSDTFTWVRGNHTWKIGGGVSAYQNNQFYDFIVNGLFDFDGTLTGNGFADFLLGIPSDFIQYPAAPSNIRTKSTNGFLQDEWHATRHLTFTIGVRYEYNSPKLDTAGRTFSIVPGIQSTKFIHAPVGLVFPGDNGAPRGANFPDRNDWAPRFGFAWNPDGQGKTSIRGGFGMFYDILKAEDNLQFNGQPPFFSAAFIGTGSSAGNFPTSLTGNSCANANQSGQPITFFSNPYTSTCTTNPFPSTPPTSNLNFGAAGFLPFGGSSAFFVDPHIRTPYTFQYNLSVQHEIAPTLSMEVNYVGSSSHGLTGLQDVNGFILGTTNRVLNLSPGNSTCQDATGNTTSGTSGAATCSLGGINEFRNVGFSNYNGMNASLTKRTGDTRLGSVYFTLGYTYGHSIDNVSGFRERNDGLVPTYGTRFVRGASDFDVRNRLVLSGGWTLPFDHAFSSAPKRLTRGWTLFPIFTWRSGFPLDVFANLGAEQGSFNEGPSGAGDIFLTRANVIAPIQMLNPKTSGNYWFDPASFSVDQSSDTVGNCSNIAPGQFPSDAQAVFCPSLRTYGTYHRNSLRGPGAVNFDLSVAKNTAITERLNLEIRADVFNLFNHAEFADPDTNPQSSTFGQVFNTGVPNDERPRIIQLAARLSF